MSRIHAVITAVGGYVPHYRLTNEELSVMVNTSDEWITQRIGIKERRILKPEEGKGVSYMAVKAIENMQKKHRFDPLEIEAVIFATSTPDYPLPNTASIVAFKTGMTRAFCFDIQAACSGFLYALEIANVFILSGRYKKIMVIAGDQLSVITDYTDRNTCPIFGDGCACVVLEANEDGNGIIDSFLQSDGSTPGCLHQYGGGSIHPASHETIDQRMHYIWQDGQTVFKHAVSKMEAACKQIIKRNRLNKKAIDWVIPHQANKRIIDSVARHLDIPIEKVMINIERYGNTSAATIPLCLWDWESQLKKGDILLLTAFGAGFSWGAIYLKWAYDSNA